MMNNAEEEDVNRLLFGKLFSSSQNFDMMTNDEAMCLLNKAQRTDTVLQIMNYFEKVASKLPVHSVQSVAEEIRGKLEQFRLLRLLDQRDASATESTDPDDEDDNRANLHPYEIVMLANLVEESTDLEEVLTWIPSLNRFEENDVKLALNMVREAKTQSII